MNNMNTAVLFSGGKDSGLALMYALKYTDVKCLITIISSSNESYMFHVPNIKYTGRQAKLIGIPLITQKTKGVKEKELKELEKAIRKAMKKYHVNAVVTGAIESAYQASRVQQITNKLGVECFNPLWQKDQFELLDELVKNRFEIVIVGIFGQGIDGLLGKKIDPHIIAEIRKIHAKLKINPAGEGGEYESFMLNAPYFKKGLIIKKFRIHKEKHGGKMMIIERISTERMRKR